MIRGLVIVLAIGTVSTIADRVMGYRRDLGWRELAHDVMWDVIGILVGRYS